MKQKTIKKTLKTKVQAAKQKVKSVKRVASTAKTKLATELKKLRGEYKELRTDVKKRVEAMKLDEKTRQLKKDLASQMRKARTNFADFKDASEDRAADLVHGASTIIGDIRKRLRALK
jgi:hypothetical protein